MLEEKDAGPMLVNILLIVVGVVFMVWISTMTKEEITRLANGAFGILALIVIQPGVLLTAKFLAQEGKPWKSKLRSSVLALAFGSILPFELLAWTHQHAFG